MVFFLVNKFGAIQLTKLVTRVGRLNSDVRLHSLACSDRHGSIIQRADGIVVIINHSPDEFIFINDYKLEPGQSISLSPDDIISFSGDETFKFIETDQLSTIFVIGSPSLSPD